MQSATTQDPVRSPVTTDALAEFLRADEDDPLLDTLLVVATEFVINNTKTEILQRDWVAIFWDWPRVNSGYLNTIKIPYATAQNQTTITEVKVNEEVITDYVLQNNYLYFEKPSLSHDKTKKDLEFSYSTGYETIEKVPQSIKDAVKLIASYLYTNRGCSAKDAYENSGAKMLLSPYTAAEALI